MRTDGRLARGEATRTSLLAAATSIVAHRGVGALTHRSVAADTGFSHALVAYHFPTVDRLRQATLIYAGDRLTNRLTDLLGESPEPGDVPTVAADLAVAMVTDLRNESITLYELMAQATRDPDLHSTLDDLICRIADLIEPLSGDHRLAATAATALLGVILTAMAMGREQHLDIIRTQVVALVDRFDPHRTT